MNNHFETFGSHSRGFMAGGLGSVPTPVFLTSSSTFFDLGGLLAWRVDAPCRRVQIWAILNSNLPRPSKPRCLGASLCPVMLLIDTSLFSLSPSVDPCRRSSHSSIASCFSATHCAGALLFLLPRRFPRHVFRNSTSLVHVLLIRFRLVLFLLCDTPCLALFLCAASPGPSSALLLCVFSRVRSFSSSVYTGNCPQKH